MLRVDELLKQVWKAQVESLMLIPAPNGESKGYTCHLTQVPGEALSVNAHAWDQTEAGAILNALAVLKGKSLFRRATGPTEGEQGQGNRRG